MKAKKLLAILALTLTATTLAACGDQTVSFGHYWFKDSTVAEKNFYEQATYAVTSTSDASSYCNYSVAYSGTFTTTFKYDSAAQIYTFKTKLDTTAIFTLGDTKSAPLVDTAESTVTFNSDLRPIESTKTMICHTPLSGNYNNVNECYVVVDYSYTTTYGKDNKIEGYCKIENSKGKVSETILNDTFDFVKDYTFIDNEQLLVAVRAFASDTSSATLASYGAFTENTQKVKFTFTNAKDKATESFNYALTDVDGTVNTAPKKILCRTASVSLDQENPGATQTIKFAKAENASTNTYRNLILEITTPLSYSMGKVYYKLTSVSYKNPNA